MSARWAMIGQRRLFPELLKLSMENAANRLLFSGPTIRLQGTAVYKGELHFLCPLRVPGWIGFLAELLHKVPHGDEWGEVKKTGCRADLSLVPQKLGVLAYKIERDQCAKSRLNEFHKPCALFQFCIVHR